MSSVRTLIFLVFIELVLSKILRLDLNKVERQIYGAGNVPLNLVPDSDYIGRISIGNPPQLFHVAFDINLGNVWVPGIECECTVKCNLKILCKSLCKAHCCEKKKIGNNSNQSITVLPKNSARDGILIPVCDKRSKFNKEISTTYHQDDREWKIQYTDGKASGKLAIDSLRLGDALNLPQTTIGLATGFPDGYKDVLYDGVLGLSRESAIQYDGLESPIGQAIKRGILDEPMITVWLDSDGKVGDTEANGVITFGGLDCDHCGFISEYLPTLGKDDWKILLKRVRIDNRISSRDWTVELDMSYPYIGGPRSVLYGLAETIKASYDHFQDVYYIDCNAEFNLMLTFDQTEYPVLSEQLIYKNKRNKQAECVLAFQNYYNLQVDWRIGAPFLRQYCVTLNFDGKVGISLPHQFSA